MVHNWKLEEGDRDLIVMQHLFEYKLNGVARKLTSSLVVTGDDPVRTGMAKTVGLPVAIAAKLLLAGQLKQTGIVVPTNPEIYEPILTELQEYGITFTEEELKVKEAKGKE